LISPYEHLPTKSALPARAGLSFARSTRTAARLFIDDSGFVLFESLAIMLHLAKKHASGKLYPAKLEKTKRERGSGAWALNAVDRGGQLWSLHAVRLPPEKLRVRFRPDDCRFRPSLHHRRV
jgi:glutathione S-transferase